MQLNVEKDMKRLNFGGPSTWLTAAAGSALAAGSAVAADDTGAFYVAPMAQYTFLDNKRDSRDNVGYQAGLGYNFAHNWAAEVNGSFGSFKVPVTMGASEQLEVYSVDFLYKFLPDSVVRPYLLFGGGYMTDKIGGGAFLDHEAGTAEAGGGLLFGIGSQNTSTRFQIRTEAKYRMEFLGANAYNPKDPGDVVVSAGFQLMFGAPTPQLIVASPPPPPPPTPPPPPPPPPAPLDSDGDGVPDSIDQCPNTPHGDRVDAVGCTIKDEIKLDRVHFATDSAQLQGENSQVLDYGAATLKKYPEMVIEVAGHTDNRGSKQHNLGLSQRRAETVMQYLKEHGVTNHMTAVGYGEENPIADNTTADGRQQNRRVGLRIVGGP
jgi:OOP family OmpA-OmpF porin